MIGSAWIRPLSRVRRSTFAPLRRAPATGAYLLAVAVTTATMIGSGPHAARRVIATASTNLHNMAWHPVYVLLVSSFWLETARSFWPTVFLLLAVMAPAERRLGTVRTVLLFAVGHVGATVLTVAPIGVGVGHGWLPHDLARAADVGPSYGIAALAGVLVTRLPRGLRRRCGIVVLLLGLATPLGLGLALGLGTDFTDAGHLVAALLGVVSAPLLARTRRHSTPPADHH